MHRHIDDEFAVLHRYLKEMASLVDRQFADAVYALTQGDVDLAQEVRRRDDQVDRFELIIDSECERLLARFQPVAADLRMIIASIKVNTDLERIADHCKNLAKATGQLTGALMPSVRGQLTALADAVRSILQDALTAFLDRDVRLAREVLAKDHEVDLLHRESFSMLIRICTEDSTYSEMVARLIVVGKGLERIADHAINIAEDVIFLIEGLDVRHPRLNVSHS